MSTDISSLNMVLQTKIDAYLNPGESKRKRTAEGDNDDDQIEIIEETSESDNLPNLMKLMVMYMKNIDIKLGNLEKKVDDHNQHCTGIDDLKTELTTIKSQLTSSTQHQSDPKKYEEDSQLKFSKISDWGQLHRQRRDAFYSSYSEQEISNEMEKWITPDDDNKVYIKKEYREKYIPGESDERYKIRESLSIQKMVANIQLRRIKVTEKENEYKSIDQSIIDRLNLLEDENQKEYLKNLWIEETLAAEQRSKTFWQDKKMKWWTKRPEEDPYEGKPTKEKTYAEATSESNNEQPEAMDETEPGKEDNENFQVVVAKNKRNVKRYNSSLTQHDSNYQQSNSSGAYRGNQRYRNKQGNGTYNNNRGGSNYRRNHYNNNWRNSSNNTRNFNGNGNSGNRNGNFFRRDQNYDPNR